MDEQIDVLLNIKLYSLRRNHLENLTLQELKEVIYHTKWLINVPDSLSKIASDISSITINDIADYYSKKRENDIGDLESELLSEEVW